MFELNILAILILIIFWVHVRSANRRVAREDVAVNFQKLKSREGNSEIF